MSTSKTYDAAVIVTSSWYGKVQADSHAEAEDAAREAFDEGKLKQCKTEIIHVDVRDGLKIFKVTYALEQGFAVDIEAASADDAEALVRKRLNDGHSVLDGSERVHSEGIVIEAEEVAP